MRGGGGGRHNTGGYQAVSPALRVGRGRAIGQGPGYPYSSRFQQKFGVIYRSHEYSNAGSLPNDFIWQIKKLDSIT